MSQPLPPLSYPPELPISAAREEIVAAIAQHQVVIVAGDTGSGKTTQLPKMCLEAGRGQGRMIGCTQPRRIAATTIAKRVAQEMGSQGAKMVGYKIRFRDKTHRGTRIKFMTDGILLAEANGDGDLKRYDTIIIDEAHERSLNIDFLLGILQPLLKKRADLHIIITSATIDTAKFSKAFKGAPVIEVGGRTFPVEMRYQEEGEADEAPYVDKAVNVAVDLLGGEGLGDMLIFMPTERDIIDTVAALEKRLAAIFSQNTPLVLPLFGRLAGPDQARVFAGHERCKVVVATNVAETSLTVPGIRYVVDTGLARILSYNPRARTTKLPVSKISQASCAQRAGRCGRVGPGICVRLFAEEDYLGREEFTRPEIQRSSLAEVILRMIHLRLGDPGRFPFIDPPAGRAISDGYALLTELGALTKGRRLTKNGRLMARLPLDPRLARMIIAARQENCLAQVVIIVAALSVQDPRIRPLEQESQADAAHVRFAAKGSDFISYLLIWQEMVVAAKRSQSQARKFCKKNYLSYQRMREWRDIHGQIIAILSEQRGWGQKGLRLPAGADSALAEVKPEQVHRAILAGNLRNIGLKKKKNIYQGAAGKELMIFPGSTLFGKGGQWVMAGELVETTRLFARTNATISPDWLEPLAGELCKSSYSDPHWQKKRGQVVARQQVSLFGLIIVAGRLVNFAPIRPAEARQIFIQTGLVEGELGGRPLSFLAENRRLLAQLVELEERTRSRVVDEFAIYDFYDHSLPAEVVDRRSLTQFIKEEGEETLLMGRADLLQKEPEAEMEKFPAQINCGEFTFKLNYRFDPGGEQDGVSVQIPAKLRTYARQEYFDWLVPGLLEEKVVALLKGLPKAVRRRLVPIPRAAAQLTSELTPYEGNLFRQLEAAISRHFGLKVEPSMWVTSNLANHLQMRFELLGEREVTGSRDPRTLYGEASPQETAGDDGLAHLAHLERDGIKEWDFAGLEPRIALRGKGGQLQGFAFPGLINDGAGGVAIRLFGTEEERQERGREGLLGLYCLQFAKGCKGWQRDFALPRQSWALYEGLASHEEFNEQLFSFILRHIFNCHSGVIPGEEEFKGVLARARAEGVLVLGRGILARVEEVLAERRACLSYLAELEAQGRGKKYFGVTGAECADFRAMVEEYLPAGFLAALRPVDLANIPRYLKGLQVRLERKVQDPARDARRQAQVQPFSEQLALAWGKAGLSPEVKEELGQYGQMIEEFKISLFAQELKTIYPISAKRLKRKWQEIIVHLP
ncbi:MAG: ATP-dependent RNA helicase HrpA [Thermodesulfobacteriota bacterium]